MNSPRSQSQSTGGTSSPTSQKRASSPHKRFSWYVPFSKEEIVHRDAKIHKAVLNRTGHRLLEHMRRRAVEENRSAESLEASEEEQILLRIRSRKLAEDWHRPAVGQFPQQ